MRRTTATRRRTTRTKRTAAVLAAAVLGAVALGACGDDDAGSGTTSGPSTTGPSTSSPGAGSGDLDGRTYFSERVEEGGAPRPLVDGTQISLTFDRGQVGASAGCNSMGGPYTLDGDVLVVDDLATTEMGCDPALHDQDEWLAAFLTGRPTATVDGDRLLLDDGTTTVTLLDREVADPDRPLAGPTWTLDTIIDGDAASSVPGGVTATLTFADDGTVAVETGCNSGGGPAEVGDTTITFGSIVTTLRACGPDESTVESAVLGVLGAGDVSYEVDANRLTLTAGDQGLSYTTA